MAAFWRIGSTGAHFHIKGLDYGAAFIGPEGLQFENNLLKGEHIAAFREYGNKGRILAARRVSG